MTLGDSYSLFVPRARAHRDNGKVPSPSVIRHPGRNTAKPRLLAPEATIAATRTGRTLEKAREAPSASSTPATGPSSSSSGGARTAGRFQPFPCLGGFAALVYALPYAEGL
jgi:hypothetical protein